MLDAAKTGLAPTAIDMPEDVLISVRNLKKYFPIQAGWLKKTVGQIKAIDEVSLDIRKGETFGLVGESGSDLRLAIQRLVWAGHFTVRRRRQDMDYARQQPGGPQNAGRLAKRGE